MSAEPDSSIRHAENWNGQDVTLCGIGNDSGDDQATTGDLANPEYALRFDEKVTCPDCIRAIRYVYEEFTPAGYRKKKP